MFSVQIAIGYWVSRPGRSPYGDDECDTPKHDGARYRRAAGHPLQGPAFAGGDGAAEGPYYSWVDQHDILGLASDTPIGTGNLSDSPHALTGGKVVKSPVPYPMGCFTKGLEGRIDDSHAGWKGRGLWATSGNRTPMHIEGIDAASPGALGRTLSRPVVVHFQLRPDRLAH